jgi:hypothetical protein
MPTLGKARNSRCNDGAWVPVTTARSSTDLAPVASSSAMLSVAAAWIAREINGFAICMRTALGGTPP